MGTVRSCDARCHKARGPACSCWCGGVFHGAGGESARDAFVKEFGAEPADEKTFEKITDPDLWGTKAGARDRWRSAVQAAVAARRAQAAEAL
jgi:hypothetical protein